jgi:unsaturated rhamnogalacturonyl hydrolase
VLDAELNRALTAALALQRKSWEQGLLGHALLDLGRPRLAELQARDAVQLQTEDGRLSAGSDDNAVNCAANGEAVLAAGLARPDPALLAALDRQLDWLVRDAPRADDGTLYHLAGSSRIWVDTIYMIVPLLALTGRADAAQAQLAGHRRRLFDRSAQLYGHIWDETGGSGRDAHWGTGNGWAVAGIARTLRHLGPDAARPFWREAAEHARLVIDACLPYRTRSGTFHDVIDDPATFEESNLVQMLAYAIFTGLADGWLPGRYAEAGHELLATAREHLDPDGFVTPVCAAPNFDRPGHSAEAQAFFLLAGASARRYENSRTSS